MVIEVDNIEEQLASMKYTLDGLLTENEGKDAQIKHHNKQIADLTKNWISDQLKLLMNAQMRKILMKSLTIMKNLMMSSKQRRIIP